MTFLFQTIKFIFIFLLLTLITQIGGFIYGIYKIISIRFFKKKKRVFKYSFFIILYLFFSLFIIPPLAQLNNRVPLPYFYNEKIPIQPARFFYCILNRHYVTPNLKKTIQEISLNFKNEHPNIRLIYLDANFPFINGFPLLPHKSHNDGKKLDLSFIYHHKKTKEIINKVPNFIGYGFCEMPKNKEKNIPEYCSNKGYWQYNLLQKTSLNFNKKIYIFDEKKNKNLLIEIAQHPQIKKIFIEPHLKSRLQLNHIDKIRFQGCASVRHDDHIHIQL